jgi:hypothetical protein
VSARGCAMRRFAACRPSGALLQLALRLRTRSLEPTLPERTSFLDQYIDRTHSEPDALLDAGGLGMPLMVVQAESPYDRRSGRFDATTLVRSGDSTGAIGQFQAFDQGRWHGGRGGEPSHRLKRRFPC